MFFAGPPRHLMIFSTRKFGREFLYPQLHHVMDFPFPYLIQKRKSSQRVSLGPDIPQTLVAPYRTILRYYRCDTSYRAILFGGRLAHSIKMVRYPPLVLSFTQAHLCDTPFCNILRDNCAIPHKNKHERVFAILSLQVSRDMRSIAAGPLSR